MEEMEERLIGAIFGELMTRTEKINLVLLALKAGGFNDQIEADGEFGSQGQKGLANFLAGKGDSESMSLVKLVFKKLDFAPGFLVLDKFIGDSSRQAVRNFRHFLKEG